MPGASEKNAVTSRGRAIKPPVSLPALRSALAYHPHAALLESVDRRAPAGAYSFYAIDPVETISIHADSDVDPFTTLAARCRPWSPPQPSDLPFVGGWIGYFSYDAGRFIEPKAGWSLRPSAFPIANWSLYDTVLVHDTAHDKWFVAGIDLPPRLRPANRPSLDDRLEALEDFVERASLLSSSVNAGQALHAKKPRRTIWDDPEAVYLNNVRRALAYIRAGDIFQVNLARRMCIPVTEHPIDIYHRLCNTNSAAYAAYLSLPGVNRAILSSSPELFLSLINRRVLTRPIKGTRPRTGDLTLDACAAFALAHSDKDIAELNMIIDLERNDLGRVCDFGSVRVLHPGEIESLPTVFHRTATVEGRLRENLDAIDLLRATFPGGSITGAPKVRAMQIINELEPFARGPYCGAIGYIGLNGDLQLNLAIRTMTIANGTAEVLVGSGIVADSDPEDEAAEINAKAAGLLAALQLPHALLQAPAESISV